MPIDTRVKAGVFGCKIRVLYVKLGFQSIILYPHRESEYKNNFN